MNSVVSDKGKKGEISLIESTRIMKKVWQGEPTAIYRTLSLCQAYLSVPRCGL